MMRRFRLGLALSGCLALGAVACNEEQEAISQITKPRVLAIQAEPPEIHPGDPSTVQLLLADEQGPITADAEVAWFVLAGAFAAVPDPSMLASDLSLAISDVRPPLDVVHGGASLVVQAGNDALDAVEPGQDSALTVFALVCARGRLPQSNEALLATLLALFSGELEDFNGICVDGDGTGLVALKQVVVSSLDKPSNEINHNPTIAEAHFHAQSLQPDSGDAVQAEYVCQAEDGCREEVALDAALTTSSYETFSDEFTSDRLDEVVYISWFVSLGKMDVDRSGVAGPPEEGHSTWGPFEANWFPPRKGGVIDLWLVAHDVRGGVSWWRAKVEALAPSAP